MQPALQRRVSQRTCSLGIYMVEYNSSPRSSSVVLKVEVGAPKRSAGLVAQNRIEPIV